MKVAQLTFLDQFGQNETLKLISMGYTGLDSFVPTTFCKPLFSWYSSCQKNARLNLIKTLGLSLYAAIACTEFCFKKVSDLHLFQGHAKDATEAADEGNYTKQNWIICKTL